MKNKNLNEKSKEKKETKNVVSRIIRALMISLGIMVAVPTLPAVSGEQKKFQSRIEHKKEIQKYNKTIIEHAEKIKKFNLTNFEVIMKVMADLQDEMVGYGKPLIDAYGYMGMDITENGIGFCRNQADYVADLLNEINPDFNAVITNVYMDTEINMQPTEIERKVIQDDEYRFKNPNILGEHIMGNHQIVEIEMPGENTILLVDPTNVALGYVNDGKYYLFSTEKGDGYEVRPLGQFTLGIEESIDYIEMMYKSRKSDLTFEEAAEKYGVEQQNDTLAALRRNGIIKSDFKNAIKYVNIKEVTPKSRITKSPKVNEVER